MTEPIEIAAILRMGDSNLYYHLKPIAMCPEVSCLHIIRPLPNIPRGKLENSRYYEIQGKTILHRLWKTYRMALHLGKQTDVKAFVSFFAFPYGFIALLAGKQTGKPVHIGFVGSDWELHFKAWYGRFLDFFLKKADCITAPGPQLIKEMLARNYPAKRLFHLPHAINIDAFEDKPPEERKYDCIFVGYLVGLKRVDLIISAIHLVKQTHPHISLCIVGDGPMRSDLEGQVRQLGLEDNVTFAGFQQQPAPWFSDARIVLIASDREGFPFTLVEGMAACAVPVSTAVGAIPDFIENGETGLLVQQGDASALGQSIKRLMEDLTLYNHIRENILIKRSDYGFENVAEKWSKWISLMSH